MQFQKSPFLLNQMMSLFFTTNPTYIHEINIFQKDYLDLKHLKKLLRVIHLIGSSPQKLNGLVQDGLRENLNREP